MSFKEFIRYEFLSLGEIRKKHGDVFDVYVKGFREMETQFGHGNFLIVQIVKKNPKAKTDEGLLRISNTTGASIGKLVPELEHLRELENHVISFTFDDNVNTILATEVKEWGN